MKLIMITVLCLLVFCNIASAEYWNTSWLSRQEIILTGNTSGAQTDYQILLNVSWVAGMQTGFDDLRFTNDTHKIDSWLESKVDSSYALVWVEFPTTPANTIEQTYYMYYENAGATSNWDIGATFLSGDDFNRTNSTTVGNGWIESYDDSFSIKNNMLEMVWSSGNNYAECYQAFPLGDYIYEWRIKTSQTNSLMYGMLHDLPLDNRLGIYFHSDGHIKVYSTEGSQLGNYAADTFYNLKMTYHSTSDKFDVLVSGGIGSINTQTPYGGPADTRFRFVTGTSAGTFYCDHVFVRKYAANPPTFIYGDIEHPEHPFLTGAYQFYAAMTIGLTGFRNGMGRYLVWGVIFFAVGLAFTLFAKIKYTLIGGK